MNHVTMLIIAIIENKSQPRANKLTIETDSRCYPLTFILNSKLRLISFFLSQRARTVPCTAATNDDGRTALTITKVKARCNTPPIDLENA